MLTDQQIRDSLYQMLVDILAIDKEEITPSSQFFADLGGESLEILELSFQCRKEFGIDPQFQKMLPASDLEVNENKELTPKAIAMLKGKLPFLDLSAFEQNPRLDHIQQLLTVEAIFQFLKMRLVQAESGTMPSNAQPAT